MSVCVHARSLVKIVWGCAHARHATAKERSWGRRRAFGAREHLPCWCALFMSVCTRTRKCEDVCEGVLMHRAAVEERLWERQRTLGV